MNKPSYSDQNLAVAVAESVSIREVLGKLGLAKRGSNYKSLKSNIARLKLDTSHHKGQRTTAGWSRLRISLEDYLSNKVKIGSCRLKKHLLKARILQPICAGCKLENWLNQPIPLELDHIDGNSDNNCLSNLRLLCPNCHALTPTYRGRNIKSGGPSRD